MIEVKERSGSRALTFGYRAILAREDGPCPVVPSAFLRDLRRQDPDLEVSWNGRFWSLYRVKYRGIVPSEDFLIKELEVKGPHGEFRELGPWLIDWLRENDKTRGGAIDPLYADRQYLSEVGADARVREERAQKNIAQAGEALQADMHRYAISDRKHFT